MNPSICVQWGMSTFRGVFQLVGTLILCYSGDCRLRGSCGTRRPIRPAQWDNLQTGEYSHSLYSLNRCVLAAGVCLRGLSWVWSCLMLCGCGYIVVVVCFVDVSFCCSLILYSCSIILLALWCSWLFVFIADQFIFCNLLLLILEEPYCICLNESQLAANVYRGTLLLGCFCQQMRVLATICICVWLN